MATKWVGPRVNNFNDIPRILNKRYYMSNISRSVTSAKAERSYSCGFTMRIFPSESVLVKHILKQLRNSDNWPYTLPFDQLVQLVVENYGPRYEHMIRTNSEVKSAYEGGKAYFQRNKDLLTYHYNGEYIAILNDTVIDHDANFSALAQRIYKKIGYISIYMPLVTLKRRVLRFESPERWSSDVS
jgi:hypothetical protein